MTKVKRLTGEILPRAYGVTFRATRRGERVMVDPFKFAQATFALFTRAEKARLLRAYAQEHGFQSTYFLEEFVEAVQKKEGSKNLLTHSRRTATRQESDVLVKNVQRYGAKINAEVKSKGDLRSNAGYHAVSIMVPFHGTGPISFYRSDCTCHDTHYAGSKKTSCSLPCFHASALETALITDELQNLSIAESATGLPPRKRKLSEGKWAAPFSFMFFNSGGNTPAENEAHHHIASSMVDYYVHNKSQYELSVKLLAIPSVYTRALRRVIENPENRAAFEVIRQEERKVTPKSTHEGRLLASIGEALDAIRSNFFDSHYIPIGYAREFVGTPYELIGQRWIPKQGQGPQYTVCASGTELPPILIRKSLGEKTAHQWITAVDHTDLHPLHRLNRPYETIDDFTRRHCVELVRLPKRQTHAEIGGIRMSQILADLYNSLAA